MRTLATVPFFERNFLRRSVADLPFQPSCQTPNQRQPDGLPSLVEGNGAKRVGLAIVREPGQPTEGTGLECVF